MKTRHILLFCLFVASCDSGGVSTKVRDAYEASQVAGDGSVTSDAIPEATDLPNDTVEEDLNSPDTSPVDQGLELSVTPEPYYPSPSFRFQDARQDGDDLLIDIVARDLGPVFGIALRVEWDPKVLDFKDAALEPVFGAEGDQALYRFALIEPGSLALALTHLYKGPPASQNETDLSGDVRLGTLRFRPLQRGSTAIRFLRERSLTVTRRLERIETSFLEVTVGF